MKNCFLYKSLLILLFAISIFSFGCSKSKEEVSKLERRILNQLSKIKLDSVNPTGATYIAFRKNGSKLDEARSYESNWEKSLENSVSLLLNRRMYPDTIEVCIPYNLDEKKLKKYRIRGWNHHRGILGLQFIYKNKKEFICPTQMIADNLTFELALKNYLESNKIGKNNADKIEIKSFEAKQFLIDLDKTGNVRSDKITEMYRGNSLVSQSDVIRENVETLAELMAYWLMNNLHDNGRLTYKYWPSLEKESNANNMIRQFMGTTAIGRWAKYVGSDEIYQKQKKNMQYNFDRFYEEDGALGFIEYRNKIKLGAASLAALSIIESKNKDDFFSNERKIRKFTFEMWNEDGSMKTFYKSKRNDNQNFYPGEALLYWSEIYKENKNPELLRKFMKSFYYYKDWHLKNRNPAFIPWHTQAYYNMWLDTGNKDLEDFIFLMNDWLIETMQKNEVIRYKDTEGRFYTSRKRFGPPHASSTGVYLEGLIDAYKLAKAVGDFERMENYRISIVKGIRSVMQLQFTDEVDTYYVSRKEKVLGGIRTTVYDNEIRVDNVQHNLMGVIKILEEFKEQDFYIQ